MLSPSQIHFHPHKPAIYVDYTVHSNASANPKTRRRRIPIRGLKRAKKETHNVPLLAEKLLLRHTDLLAHISRERLRTLVQHVVSVVTHEVAVDLEQRENNCIDDQGEERIDGSITRKSETAIAERPADKSTIADGSVDLNKLGDEELRQIKQEWDKEFDKVRVKPGDPGFVYDRRVEFSSSQEKEENDWDEDDDAADVGYIPSQSPHVSSVRAVRNGLTSSEPSDMPHQPIPSTIISPAATVPEESPTLVERARRMSPQSAQLSDVIPSPKATAKPEPAQLGSLATSPLASSQAPSAISELPCEEIPSQVSPSPSNDCAASPVAHQVVESPSLIPPSPVPALVAPGPGFLQQAAASISVLSPDPIPEDAYEDDFSDFGAGETASHVSSKPSSIRHSRTSTHQSEPEIEAGATDSEHESDADDENEALSSQDSGLHPMAKPVEPIPRLLPVKTTASLTGSALAGGVSSLEPAGPLKSMHDASAIDEEIDEEIEVFEDDIEAGDA